MNKRVLVGFVAIFLSVLIAIFALARDENIDRDSLKKMKSQKIQLSKLPSQRAQQELEQEASSAALRKLESTTVQETDTIFRDEFEGMHDTWQATASWGNRPAPGGGLLDEDSSDWEIVTDNFLSPTTSWHETGETFLQTDMVLSPVINVPTEVTVGGITSPLKATNLSVYLDWDNVGANSQFRVYAGLADTLWDVDGTDPGVGDSSWVLQVPTSGPYVEFIRQFLTTPVIDLTGATAPVNLSFLFKSVSEPEFDYNKVDISTDNFVSYHTVFSHSGGLTTGGVNTWTDTTIDLSAYVGETVQLRFSQNGDFGFVEPDNIFALDSIDVSDAGGSIFFDDGGDTPSSMVPSGFVPGNELLATLGPGPQPTPNWLSVSNMDVLFGSDDNVEPGDDIRIGVVFVSDSTPPGRGLYIDDVTLEGIGKFTHDVAALTVEPPFVAQVGQPQNFELNISNEGLSPEVGFTWRGRIYDAAGNFITQVIGSVSDTIAVNDTATVTSTTAWTPQESGIYQIQAITSLNTDQDRSNDTTMTINTGGGFYSQFYVAEEELVFSRRVDDAPADPTAGTLESLGFRVRSNTPPGVVTWHTGSDPRTGLPGALIVYDSLARPQDEELIIPNLDFSYMTSDVVLNFYGQSVAGFTYTRISVSVSNDGGHTWHDVWERRRGIDPQTGTNYGGPAFLRFLMNPAHVDITNYAAGESNVWVRFRYQGYFDESWVVWNIALSGKGLRAANLSGVTDIPNDNGKQVRLTWDASANDGQLNGVPITEYGVWRMVPASGTTMPVSNKVVEVENRKEMIRLANVSKIEPGTRVYSSATPESWDFIGTVTAHSDSIYNYVAPTLEDSVQTCFMISAHTANPQVFANSNTQCGMSIDNLAPNVPGNFASMVNDIGGGNFTVELSWDRNKDEDFRYYSLYKDGQLLEQLTDTAFVDSNVAQNQTVEYDLTATDFAGNESDPAELTVVVTGIGDDPNAIPTEFALDQNFPNPFNPTTTLQYALKENARVKLQIYNVLGQLVKTLIDENQTAGYKEVVWDGTNNQGLKVPSGIYIYRIKANDFVESRKMILMK